MFPTGYLYPDGTRSSRKPKDGEVFYITKNGSVESTWQWDDMLMQWFNVSSGKATKANTATHVVPTGVFVDPNPVGDPDLLKKQFDEAMNNIKDAFKTPIVWDRPKCECGSDAVGSPRHSSWCCKYDPLT